MTAPAFREQIIGLSAEAGITLSEKELERFERYYRLLERWNRTINLTALELRGYPVATLRRLFLESIVASRLVEDAPLTWLDLGSGGGSPAIPLKTLRPAAKLTLVESRARKAAFLREAVRSLELTDTTVLVARFEELTRTETGPADLLTARALRVDETLWETCRRVLQPAGRFVLFTNSPVRVAVPTDFAQSDDVQVSGCDATVLGFARVFHVERR